MRILFLHTIGKNKFGGGEHWVVNAAAGLKALGHYVVVAGVKNSVLLDESARAELETKVFPISNDINIFKAFTLSRYIANDNIDVVICKSRELAMAGLALKMGKPFLLIRRTGSPPSKKSLKLYLRTKWFVDGVVTNTQTIKDIYNDLGFKADDFVKVIYNGLITDDQTPSYNFNMDYPGKTIFACLGRAVRDKGYFFLIDALAEIRKTHPEVLFFVMGDGKDKGRLIQYALEKGVSEMIHFAGYIHKPAPYLKGSDFFLHPSLYEGMPNAAMEAMGYGKPVIMTRVNGADELSQSGEFARLIPPADSKAIAFAVVEMLQHKSESLTMGKRAKAHIRENFSRPVMISKLEDYLLTRLELKKNKAILKF
jgi:glycosyltransferase involved in cell wall biosynthesis